jgi:hypothetical protein
MRDDLPTDEDLEMIAMLEEFVPLMREGQLSFASDQAHAEALDDSLTVRQRMCAARKSQIYSREECIRRGHDPLK